MSAAGAYSLLNKVENAHSDPIYCCAWAKVKINQDSVVNDNYVLTGGLDGLVKVWNVINNKFEILQTLRGHAMAIVSIAVSSKGIVFASASLDSIIILWDLPKCMKIKQINTDKTDAWQIAFSPNSSFIVSGRHNGNLTVYDIENNSIETEMYSRGPFALSVAWSDDGKHIACGSVDGNVHIFDPIQHKLLHTLNAHTETVRSVNFSPSSKLLVSGSTDGYVKIFNTYNTNTVCSLKLDSWVMSVCFSPDESRVAIATGDGAVTIALAANLKVLKTFQEHTGKVCDVKFNSDGTKLISVAKDNSINVYECPIPLKK